MNITALLNKLLEKKDLTTEETRALLAEILAGKSDPVQIGALLTAFRMKGETVSEIRGFIESMREHMVSFVHPNAVDVCGTGGDGHGTFNISTTVAFVVAGAGAHVAKHGNRAASSKCGSADVLEALGVNTTLSADQAQSVLEKVGMVFLFAPLYHPAMKYIAPVRKALGIRTIFNVLGPFLNPASVRRQLVGVPDLASAKKLAQVAVQLNYDYLIIATSENGMDEIAISGKTKLFIVRGKTITTRTVNPEKLGIKKVSLAALQGGTAHENAQIIRHILHGEKSSKRDIVILNSAYALVASGKIPTVDQGMILAKESIDSGRAYKVLENLIKETQTYA